MEMIAVKIKISSGATEDAFNVKGRRHEAEAFEICSVRLSLCWNHAKAQTHQNR